MPAAPPTLFLLSPAHAGGRRAQWLLREQAAFPLALALRSEGAPLGEVYAFLSGLYFRGKLAYARACAARGAATVRVIVPGRGLVDPGARVTLDELRAIAEVPVDPGEPRYRGPLERDARRWARAQPGGIAVLLGSIATGKYVDVLLEVFGARLHFPAEFVGRGDMSRGGLLLRAADERRTLATIAARGAVRHGARPPKLAPRPRRVVPA
ncbi:MAG TPA: hypothetical protein VFK69_13605 [Candidatus Eisenbacteria bacterium]|nr:hypothetical protein [Candidatus Eisenbacteria bacterium]